MVGKTWVLGGNHNRRRTYTGIYFFEWDTTITRFYINSWAPALSPGWVQFYLDIMKTLFTGNTTVKVC